MNTGNEFPSKRPTPVIYELVPGLSPQAETSIDPITLKQRLGGLIGSITNKASEARDKLASNRSVPRGMPERFPPEGLLVPEKYDKIVY